MNIAQWFHFFRRRSGGGGPPPPPAPVAKWTATPRNGVEDLEVVFSNTSTGNPTSNVWDFGDGGSSVEVAPTYTYTTPGTYSPKLTVSNAGGSSSKMRTNYITVTASPTPPPPPPPPAPEADFSATPLLGVVPVSVAFTDLSTNTPTSWAWDFGDGGTSTSQSPTHNYTVAGTYSPKLTATNAGGSDEATKTDYIALTAPPPVTLYDTGRIGGQFAQLIDFTGDAVTCDLMKRARNVAKTIGSPYQFTEATCLLRIASLTRTSNVTTVVLSEAPGSYQGDANIRTGFRLVLTCPADPTFDCDHAVITVTDQTHFTYPNTGSNGSYTAVNIYDIAASTIHSVAVGAAGHPIEDFSSYVCTAPGPATSNPDLNGTYTGYFDGGIPTGMTVSGAALTNWTPGGGDNQFTVTIDSTDTEGIEFVFTGVPTDGTFRMPRVIRNDHDQSGNTFLRPDFKTFASRYGYLRFMDWGKTNLNAFIKSWEKRPLIACGLGVTLADMVKTCNELGCNMWYCVPFWASDDYITQAATYIKNNLNSGRWCIYERCNEDWNDNTFPHLMWDLTLCRQDLKAWFHGSYGEAEIASVSRSGGVVTVNTNRPPPFANGATAVFKITSGSSGFDTPDAGAVMTVSGNSFSFTGGSASGSATVTRATVIGDPADPLYSDHLYLYRELAFRMHGKKTYDMSQLISAVYGGLNTRARVVLMGWNTNFVPFGIQEDLVFPWLQAQYGPLSNWCYGIGGAPYPETQASNTTPAQVKTRIYSQLDSYEAYFTRATNLASFYGVHHVQYEGGPDLTALGTNHTLIDSLYSASEFRDIQHEVINRALSKGVEFHCIYTGSVQLPGASGGQTWGIALSLAADGGAMGSATSTKLQGLDDALLAAPP